MKVNLPDIRKANVKNKTVLVRCDFDVPVSSASIVDDSRLVSSVETIEFLLKNGAVVIAVGHMGRPEKEDLKFSLEIIAKWFAKKILSAPLVAVEVEGFKGWKINDNFYILENLRFYKGEEENDKEFCDKLAQIADIYVNEAFGSSHRAHASIVGIANILPHFAGIHLQKEISVLSSILDEPKRPFTFIIGGAKIETKLPLIARMHKLADYVLVGGELAERTKILAHEQHKNLIGQKAILLVAEQNQHKTDITSMSTENFKQIILSSACIVWNGPMGFIEHGDIEGTKDLADAIIKSSAYKVVGGGDTVGYLGKEGLLKGFDFVSVGGGAMLEFLSGLSLPGISALEI